LTIQDIQIIKVGLKHLPDLQKISRKTFHDSFAEMNTPANMQMFLEHHFSEDKLRAELLTPESEFFFAKSGDSIAGYFKINRGDAQSVLPNEGGLELERIYVDDSFKGKGIGHLCIQKAVETARSYGLDYVWLGVWEHNTAAIRFYGRNGFITYSDHIFFLGDDPQTDLLMKKLI
jgi:ribosomal protein S18 acetylase RimI-like enzyme